MKTVLINRAVPGSGKTTWWRVTPENPAAHEVPESSMREHIADFNTYNVLLDKNAVPDPARHFNYRWDERLQDVVRVFTPVKPFDYDILIQVPRETYHELMDRIEDKILRTMTSSTKTGAPIHIICHSA